MKPTKETNEVSNKKFELTYNELLTLLKESYFTGYSTYEMVDAGLEPYDADGYARWKLSGMKTATLNSDIEKLIRYTIKQWSSLNEIREPDHEDLVQSWLDGDCKDWIQSNLK